ncbi:MAG: Arc family DNA-binding protein [Clostridiales bacterium]|jgi:hypothetical protein|nr:Arc family DNA-binding protein [Clostridiales bacterium]
MPQDNDGKKKQILLRISDSLWKDLASWAEDDFRSINGQIEYLLTECVKRRKRGNPIFNTDITDK